MEVEEFCAVNAQQDFILILEQVNVFPVEQWVVNSVISRILTLVSLVIRLITWALAHASSVALLCQDVTSVPTVLNASHVMSGTILIQQNTVNYVRIY